MSENNKEAVVEAILFTMGDSVPVDRLAAVLDMDKNQTWELLRAMMQKYQSENRGIQIIELEDCVQMCTKPEMYESIIRIAKQPKKQVLTDVLRETLAIVANKQPVTRLEIEKIRGVKSDHAVNKLIEYNLIAEMGRLDVPGRPILFGTTEEFLRCFGVQSVDELPLLSPEKLEDFKQEAEEEMNAKISVDV